MNELITEPIALIIVAIISVIGTLTLGLITRNEIKGRVGTPAENGHGTLIQMCEQILAGQVGQDNRLAKIEAVQLGQGQRIAALELLQVEHNERIHEIEINQEAA